MADVIYNAYIRDIEFANTFIEVTTTTTRVYLKYLLPYASTLSIFTGIDALIDKGFSVKNFLPGEVYLETELTDFDNQSTNYNEYRITDYINRGIFTRITMTDSNTTTEGAPPSISNYYVYTDFDIYGNIVQPSNYIAPVIHNGYFGKDGNIYLDSSFDNGDGLDIGTQVVNSISGSVTNAPSLTEGSHSYVSKTNTVVDSNGYLYKIGDSQGTYELFLLNNNIGRPNPEFTNIINDSGLKNLMIDQNDNFYLLTGNTCYKLTLGDGILASIMFTYPDSYSNGSFVLGIMNIYSNTMYVLCANNTIQEFMLDGSGIVGSIVNSYILAQTPLSFSISFDFLAVALPSEGPSFIGLYKLSDMGAGSEQIDPPTDLYGPIVDGGPGVVKTGDINGGFILPYDIRNVSWDTAADILFTDMVYPKD
ncbi:MAG: hypothetical protein WCO84_06075 [bacterium]